MQGLGYKEIVRYLEGEYSLNEAIDIIKRDTRHFAKRQLTWFRREKEVTMLEYENFNNDINSMCDEMIRQLKIKNIV
jgi:tRNA dimethylallyltransferase